MKYLDYTTSNLKLRIFAPIFRENNRNCRIKRQFKFTRDGLTWKENNGTFFSITYGRNNRTKELQVKWSGDPNIFIVKQAVTKIVLNLALTLG